MLYRDICKILGLYFIGLTIALTIPFFLAIYYQFIADPNYHPQPHTTIYFFWSIVICLILASGCYYYGRRSTGQLYRKEGLAAVFIIWFVTPAIAALPFYLSGTLDNPFQAYFEATSGFTTTGATTMHPKQFDLETGKEIPVQRIVQGIHTVVYSFYGTIDPVRDPITGEVIFEGIEAVSKALLFWRSFTQWLGGMGIIVLFVAVFPFLGVGGKMLFQAEVPGPVKDSLTPRIKETASHLWKIYLGISIIETLLLLVTNREMTWLEAVTITFSTMSTGGFTIHNASIGFFANPVTEWIIIIFMVMASINFSHYYNTLKGKFFRIYEPELILYIILLLFSCCLVSFLLVGTQYIPITGELGGFFSIGEAIRHGFFQVISAQTTTGFVTTDYDGWPYPAQTILLLVMFLGGMSGSTAGGMKIIRHFMLFRIAQYKVESLFRPMTVRRFRIGKKEIDSNTAILVLVYFLIVATFTVFSILFFVIDGLDPESALALVTLLINNIGIGFRMVSPTESCAFLSNFGYIFSCFLMVLGRLEFLAVLAVLVPAFWKQNK